MLKMKFSTLNCLFKCNCLFKLKVYVSIKTSRFRASKRGIIEMDYKTLRIYETIGYLRERENAGRDMDLQKLVSQ